VTERAAASVWRRFALPCAGFAAAFVGATSAFAGGSAGAGATEVASAASGALLGSNAACAAADDPGAPLAAQQRAITCLINVARRQADRPLLATPPKLRKAAAIKGHRVVSCGQFSHTPCGSAATAAIRAAGYPYGWFGENLFAGTWGAFSPRQVVDSWLGSPGHRANILRPGFRVFGASRVRAHDVFGEAETAVWVATFASPKSDS
jgi:uncharacterized protein YkwD